MSRETKPSTKECTKTTQGKLQGVLENVPPILILGFFFFQLREVGRGKSTVFEDLPIGKDEIEPLRQLADFNR